MTSDGAVARQFVRALARTRSWTGRAVVLLGGGVCLFGLVLSAPSFRPQLIPPPQTSVLTHSCLGLSLLRCLEACATGEGRR